MCDDFSFFLSFSEHFVLFCWAVFNFPFFHSFFAFALTLSFIFPITKNDTRYLTTVRLFKGLFEDWEWFGRFDGLDEVVGRTAHLMVDKLSHAFTPKTFNFRLEFLARFASQNPDSTHEKLHNIFAMNSPLLPLRHLLNRTCWGVRAWASPCLNFAFGWVFYRRHWMINPKAYFLPFAPRETNDNNQLSFLRSISISA